MDFLTITKKFGKPACVGLYAWFAYLAAKKKPLPLLILLGLHSFEYFDKGQKIAEEHNIDKTEAIAQCLAFGFCWWLPLSKGE